MQEHDRTQPDESVDQEHADHAHVTEQLPGDPDWAAPLTAQAPEDDDPATSTGDYTDDGDTHGPAPASGETDPRFAAAHPDHAEGGAA